MATTNIIGLSNSVFFDENVNIVIDVCLLYNICNNCLMFYKHNYTETMNKNSFYSGIESSLSLHTLYNLRVIKMGVGQQNIDSTKC